MLHVLQNDFFSLKKTWTLFSFLSPLLTCTQVAVKNSIDVFYFSVLIPLNIFFVEDGKMGKMIVAKNSTIQRK